MNNKNYRVMKFFESVNKQSKSRGYVRLDIRGIRGNMIVSVENLGDVKTVSEVFLYKDRTNKIKLGDINNKKGMLKKLLTFGSNNAIEDYNICAVVKDKKIVMYTNLFNACSLDQIRKLEVDDTLEEEVSKLDVEPVQDNEPESAESEDIKETFEEIEEEVIEENKQLSEIQPEESEMVNDEVESEKNNVEESENDRIKKTSVNSAVDMNADYVEPENNQEPEVEAQAHKFRSKFEESLYSVLKDYKQVDPLSVKIKNFYWWYIPYDETGIKNGFLPYYSQVISSYYPYPMSNRVTTCSSLMKKYGHYIFGIYKEKGDIVKFVYGVPGEFTKEEQPYKGITGFKNWSYSNKENYDKHGYWLAFVNPRTGETTEPPEIALT